MTAAARIAAFLDDLGERVSHKGRRDAAFDPPYSTIHVGSLHGGSALNFVPDRATLEFEIRYLPEADAGALLAQADAFIASERERLKRQAAEAGIAVEEMASYPALMNAPDCAAVATAERLAGCAGGATTLSFGTEAGLYAQAGIPTVVIDSALASDRQVSFVATDNRAGGRIAGERLLAVATPPVRVIMLRYQAGSASTEDREAGFLEALQGRPGVEILSSDQHGGATRESALTAAQNLLGRYGRQVTAIYTPNESSTAGMALAIEQAGLAGRVVHVGFDTSPPLIAALAAGRIHGLVAQDPTGMGYLGVKALVDHLDGKPVAKRTDTPVRLITPDNLASPEIQALLKP